MAYTLHDLVCIGPTSHESPGARLALFFYENLVAASVECSSRIVEVARRNEISRAKNFFATFC